MAKKCIITIGRQCGSGGREIGQKLAQKLGVPFYDRELLRLAAQQSGLASENIEMFDEVPTSSLLYSLSLGNRGVMLGQYEAPIHQRVFLAQFETIQKLADKGESCVILGRCADYALREREQVVKVFLKADPAARVARMLTLYDDLTEKKAADQMVKTDKRRAAYYNFYSDTHWGSVEGYDLVVDSLRTGIDHTVEIIADYANRRFPE